MNDAIQQTYDARSRYVEAVEKRLFANGSDHAVQDAYRSLQATHVRLLTDEQAAFLNSLTEEATPEAERRHNHNVFICEVLEQLGMGLERVLEIGQELAERGLVFQQVDFHSDASSVKGFTISHEGIDAVFQWIEENGNPRSGS